MLQLENELRLSYYKEIASVDEKHNVKLTQHVETGKFYVVKKMDIYDMRVYDYLYTHPMPGVPRIVELIENDDYLYVIEDFVSGVTLREMLDSGERFTEAEARGLICQLCDILQPLHKLSPPIVHRDIKPENIIITPYGNLVLVDFNSAKVSAAGQSQDTVLFGTAGYAAPEQYGFSQSQPSADVYAIGVLLNELLTGAHPSKQHYRGKLARIINKCMQMDSNKRFKDAAELNAACSTSFGNRLLDEIRSFLPPGLNSKNPFVFLCSLLLYVFLIVLCTSIQVTGYTGARLDIMRCVTFLSFFCSALLIGNYRHVQDKFIPETRHPILTKILYLTAATILIFFLFILAGTYVPVDMFGK